MVERAEILEQVLLNIELISDEKRHGLYTIEMSKMAVALRKSLDFRWYIRVV